MAKLIVDYEYNAEDWWDAAREHADSLRDPLFTRLVNRLQREDEVEVTQGEADQFAAAAKQLTGWDDGPEHARRPVIIQVA